MLYEINRMRTMAVGYSLNGKCSTSQKIEVGPKNNENEKAFKVETWKMFCSENQM